MAKTRSQSSTPQVKEESHRKEHKATKLLHNVRSTTTAINSNKITKNNSNRRLPITQVKVEETNDKVLLRKKARSRWITPEQVKQLIKHIEENKMTVSEASKKANMSKVSGIRYYNMYKMDPQKKIPVPRNLDLAWPEKSPSPSSQLIVKSAKDNWVTQEQIERLIHYIEKEKMSVNAASLKVDLGPVTAYKYYRRFKEDPEGKIPTPRNSDQKKLAVCTADQIKELIRYIVNDKLSVNAASVKVKMSPGTSMRYYMEYLEDPNHKIPTPKFNNDTRCTFEQKRLFIDFLFNDKLTLREASINSNMSEEAGIKYYSRNLMGNGTVSKIPERLKSAIGPYTHDQIKELVHFVVDEKMSIRAALTRVSKMPLTD